MEQEIKQLIQKLPPSILEHIGSEVFKIQLGILCDNYKIDPEDQKEVEDTLYGFFIGMYNPFDFEYLLMSASLLDEETNKEFSRDVYGLLVEPVENELVAYWEKEVLDVLAPPLTPEEERLLEEFENEQEKEVEIQENRPAKPLAFPSQARTVPSASTQAPDPYREVPAATPTPVLSPQDRLQKAVFSTKKASVVRDEDLLAARKALMDPYREKIDDSKRSRTS